MLTGKTLTCGRWDLNPHDIAATRSLVLLVCQFRHFRIFCRPGNIPNNRDDYSIKISFRQLFFYSTRKAVTGSLLAAFLAGSRPLIRVRTMLRITSTAAPTGGRLPLISSVLAK